MRRQGTPLILLNGLLWSALIGASGCTVYPDAVLRVETRPISVQRSWVRQLARGPVERRGPAVAARAAATAQSMVGVPYRWGGDTPAGFDCSGLVYYSYARAGAAVPRTSGAQFKASRPLALHDARAGDLVFFRINGKVSHVGIYLADGRFVHAPAKGKKVQVASLRSGYYARNFLRAGRLSAAGRARTRVASVK